MRQPSPAKKELVAKLLQLQQPGIEDMARNLVERPAVQMMQAAGGALQAQVPPDKREAVAKSIEADVRKYVDEAVPLLRERAVKLAPTTFGAALEEKFTEDELQPADRLARIAGQQEVPAGTCPRLQSAFAQKLVADAGPLLDPQAAGAAAASCAGHARRRAGAPAGAAAAPRRSPPMRRPRGRRRTRRPTK